MINALKMLAPLKVALQAAECGGLGGGDFWGGSSGRPSLMRLAGSNLPLRDSSNDKTPHDADGFKPGGGIRVALARLVSKGRLPQRAIWDSELWVSGAKGTGTPGYHMLDE